MRARLHAVVSGFLLSGFVLFASVSQARADVEFEGFTESIALSGLSLPTAIAFLPDGRVIVAWAAEEDGVRIEVRDDGPGIPAEDRDGVFEPFRTGRAGGTGLGLAIARDGIVAQGGTVHVDDAPEGGARFVIRMRTGDVS